MAEQEQSGYTKKTSIKVQPGLWQKAKIRAAQEETTLSAFNAQALRKKLASHVKRAEKSV